MNWMLASEPLRHEDLHKFSDKLLASIAEKLFGMTVHQDDTAPIIHQDDAARRSFRRQAKQIFCLLPLRHIHRNAPGDDSLAVRPGHAASTLFHPAYPPVRKYNPILALVIFAGREGTLDGTAWTLHA